MGYVFQKSGGCFLITLNGDVVHSSDNSVLFKIDNNKLCVIVSGLGDGGSSVTVGHYLLSEIDSIGGNAPAASLNAVILQLNDLVLPTSSGGGGSSGGLTNAELRANPVTFRMDQTTPGTTNRVDIGNDGVVISAGNRVAYYPSYGAPDATEVVESSIDTGGAIITRSAALTDEGTYRVNFTNSSLAISIGTITSIVGNIVTGTNFDLVDVHLKDYFKLDADPESAWKQIKSVDSATQITLYANYVGGTSGAASRSLVQPVTGAGASITVLNGQGIITAGTTSGAVSFLNRAVDYGPLVFRTRLSISQRIVNQNIRIGFAEGTSSPKWFARFRCDGAVSTVNTTIICETAKNPSTAPSVAETETTSVTIPNGGNTSQFLDYRIEHLVESIKFYINGILVAEHFKSLPSPYDYMASGTRIENVGVPASSTVISIDFVTTKNHNKLEIGVMSESEKLVASQPPLVPYIFTQTGAVAINTDLLTIDCSQLRSLFIQCTSMGTSGTVTPAWSNDGVNYVNTSINNIAGTSGASATFNAAGSFTTPVSARYFRLRLTTGASAGTTTINVQGSQHTLSPSQFVLGASTAAIGAVTVTSGTITANGGAGVLVADVVSGAITTSTTTGAITPSNGSSYEVYIAVTAVSGTTPSLQLNIEESDDTGTNYQVVYSFPAITTTGMYRSPVIPLTGNRIRYVQTVTGTTPSFTRSIGRTQMNAFGKQTWAGKFNSTTSSITTGGTAQVAIAASDTRKHFEIQNLSSEDLFICFGGTASATNGFVIPSKAMYSEPVGYSTTVAISIFGATTGQLYTYIQK